ncbi:MAG: hypothetical protein ACUVX8_08815 [Candidatus Zipacnadales bacterium]
MHSPGTALTTDDGGQHWGVRSYRRMSRLLTVATAAALMGLEAETIANQQAGGPNKTGALVLLLLPVTTLLATSLHITVLALFPRFGRRCATAVGRYGWQTILIGLASALGAALVAALLNAVVHNPQVGAIPLGLVGLLGAVGGSGVSMQVGRWVLKRLEEEAPTHPVLEVLVGGCVLGWTLILIPCVGQVAWLGVGGASLGAFVLAVVAGRRLDEVPLPKRPASASFPATCAASGAAAAAEIRPPEPRPETPQTEDSQVF